MCSPLVRASSTFLVVFSPLFFPSLALSNENTDLGPFLFAAVAGSPTIVNPDYQVASGTATVSISNVTQAEGNSGVTAFVFDVTLSEALEKAVSVSYSTMDGSATTGNVDYVAATGTASIAAMSNSTTITINVNGDTIFEQNETFTVELSNPENATIGSGTGTGTVINDDELPKISIDDVSLEEGIGGPTQFGFTLCLSDNEHEEEVTVDYATADGSATTANDDYVAATGTVTFTAKELSCAVIEIIVNGDATFEETETFKVILSNPQNATIASSGTGTGTIVNDDELPKISIDDVSETEGNGGTTEFVFKVSLSHAHHDQVAVQYTTMNGSATTANDDYVAATGTATIAAKEISTEITINVNGDTKFEQDETFTVVLSNPENATIESSSGTGTILNDDDKPSISIRNVSEYEGDSGLTAFRFEIYLSHEHYDEVTVDYATTAGSATANVDYLATNGTVVIPAKMKETTINVDVIGDIDIEPDEFFVVNLFNIMGATVGDIQGRGLIFNDDGLTAVADPPVTEFALGSIAPNPSVHRTRIDYEVAREVPVRLSVYDIQGREVVVLASGIHRPGRYQAMWKGEIDGRPAPASVYFVRYQVPGKHFVRRLAITR